MPIFEGNDVAPLFALFALVSIAGCGANPAASSLSGSTRASTNLNGNWLLAGSLPFTGIFGTPQNPNFGVAGTFAVTGTKLEAALSENIPCPSGSVSGPGTIVTGTIAGDGSFTAQSPAIPSASTATLTGTVPSSGDSSWTGHLVFSNPGSYCAVTRDIPVSAIRLGYVTGNYTGSSTLSTPSLTSPDPYPVTVTLTLQQGVSATGPAGLSGTVAIQGSPCFASGVLLPGSGVLGSVVTIEATMNDGSTLAADGQVMDSGALALTLNGARLTGGSCGPMLLSTAVFTHA